MPYTEVMPKFRRGQLHSGSKGGPKVRSRKQALAIMLSEKRNGTKDEVMEEPAMDCWSHMTKLVRTGGAKDAAGQKGPKRPDPAEIAGSPHSYHINDVVAASKSKRATPEDRAKLTAHINQRQRILRTGGAKDAIGPIRSVKRGSTTVSYHPPAPYAVAVRPKLGARPDPGREQPQLGARARDAVAPLVVKKQRKAMKTPVPFRLLRHRGTPVHTFGRGEDDAPTLRHFGRPVRTYGRTEECGRPVRTYGRTEECGRPVRTYGRTEE